MRIGPERAALAMCRSAAVRLAYGNRERMELIEETHMALRRVRGKGLAGESSQRFVAPAIAAGHGWQKMMPLTDTAQVLVGNWNWMAQSVKKDGISSLWTNAGQSQQAGTQGVSERGGKGCKRAAELLVEHGHKRLQRGRLAGVKAGGLD